MKNNFKVIGMMSGTSLDGLDLAFCEFRKNKTKWEFTIKEAKVVKYPPLWFERLSQAQNLSGAELAALDADFGRYLGKACKKFISDFQLSPDFISSHGHTIFHQPGRGFTYQLGNGNAIHAETGVPVIYDFRALDVFLGGQGAPLVPAGDRYLFSDFDICLNLGGIANMSAEIKRNRYAYDVCFCNMPLNYLVKFTGKAFDKGGMLAAEGEVNSDLLKVFRKLYLNLRKRRPSLGRELFETAVKPHLDLKGISLKDKLATSVEATAEEIAYAAVEMKGKSMLCTGGGAFNSFLISRLLDHCGDSISIIVPEEQVVKFKEALIFAFLGVLRLTGKNNSLSTVTGAMRDSSGGTMIGFDHRTV